MYCLNCGCNWTGTQPCPRCSNPVHDWDGLIKDISVWQRKAFPKATALSKYEHLRKEMDELGKVIRRKYNRGEGTLLEMENELADCVMLLIGIAAYEGADLYEALRTKLEVNKKRVWGDPDPDGVVEHKR